MGSNPFWKFLLAQSYALLGAEDAILDVGPEPDGCGYGQAQDQHDQ